MDIQLGIHWFWKISETKHYDSQHLADCNQTFADSKTEKSSFFLNLDLTQSRLKNSNYPVMLSHIQECLTNKILIRNLSYGPMTQKMETLQIILMFKLCLVNDSKLLSISYCESLKNIPPSLHQGIEREH